MLGNKHFMKTYEWNELRYININVNVDDQNGKATLNENMIACHMRKIKQKLGGKCFYPLSFKFP